MSSLAQSDYLPQSPLDAAITYAAQHWPVLPCHAVLPNSGGCTCGVEHCPSPGKHPVIRGGLKAASTDLKQVRYWWDRWPRANIAICTGASSGLVVIDVDPRHGGLSSLRELIAANEALPSTMVVSTGSDGLHFYFRHPGGLVRNDAGRRLGQGLDIRGDGGYVIAPPSRHMSGGEYHWAADTDLAPLPEWLHDRVREPEHVRVSQPVVTGASAWAHAALDSEVATMGHAAEGTRNHTLNRAAFNLGQIVGSGTLERNDVESALVEAGIAVGLTDRECTATVASGLDAGIACPRKPTQRKRPTTLGRQRSERDVGTEAEIA